MELDLDATTLKALKATDPAKYRATLARIESARLGWDSGQVQPPATPEHATTPRKTRSFESLTETFRKAAAADAPEGGSYASLTDYRRSLIYACTSLRADMLAGLPIRLYRWANDDETTGRKLDLTRPISRAGKPRTIRGQALGSRRSLVEVEGAPLVALLSRPNEDTSWRAIVRQVETSLCLVGQAHVMIHRAGARLSGMSYVKHDRLEVIRPSRDDPQRTVAGWKLDGARGTLVPSSDMVWLRYSDPDSPDYGAISPAQMASLGSEAYGQAMRSNLDIFRRGLRGGAVITPPDDMGSLGWDQVDELQADVDRQLRGARNNHNVTVLPYRFGFERLDITPHDAEFVALLEFAIEDVARAFRIPIEMVGGTRRTYANNEAADRALWQRCLEPEASWIAEELTRVLIPSAGLSEDYVLGFDLCDVIALQDDESLRWSRDRELAGIAATLAGQAGMGTLTPEQAAAILVSVLEVDPEVAAAIAGGEVVDAVADPLALPSGAGSDLAQAGEAAAPATSLNGAQIAGLIQLIQLIGTAPGQLPKETVAQLIVAAFALPRDRVDEMIAEIPAAGLPQPTPEEAIRAALTRSLEVASRSRGSVEWDSAEHRGILERADKRQRRHVQAFGAATRRVMERQEASILAKLAEMDRRTQADHTRKAPTLAALKAAFDLSRWIVETRTAVAPIYKDAAKDAGRGALDAVGAAIGWTGDNKPTVNALQRRSQRFAQSINETTWDELKRVVGTAIEAGEGVPGIASLVREVMGARIRSSGETIARTEIHGTFETAGRLAISQASDELGLTYSKEWVSALDDRVRDDHAEAHGQTVGIDEDFEVGGASGPNPGEMGEADQDINCRCSSKYTVVRSAA